jgi:hypothetical protein
MRLKQNFLLVRVDGLALLHAHFDKSERGKTQRNERSTRHGKSLAVKWIEWLTKWLSNGTTFIYYLAHFPSSLSPCLKAICVI